MREKASILIQIQIGTRIGSKFRQISESGSKSNISGSTTLFSMVYTLFYEHSLSYFTYQAFHKLPKSINQKHFEQNKQNKKGNGYFTNFPDKNNYEHSWSLSSEIILLAIRSAYRKNALIKSC